MITYAKYILTSDLERFLVILTSLAIAATVGLIVLELIKQYRSKVKVFWAVVYFFTALNVVVWAFVLC